MLTIPREVWAHIESLRPAFIAKNPHFNFITIHYFWIIGCAIFGSICIYPNGGIPYIDALFLCAGAATQSGLNTRDLNTLNTWQQLVLYFITMFANPIMINTFVVFLRLYWFEKRFQHVTAEAKRNRRSIAKSMSKAKPGDRDLGREERGIQGRSIVVIHNTTRPNGMTNDGRVPAAALEEHLKRATTKDEVTDDGTGSSDWAGESPHEEQPLTMPAETTEPSQPPHQTQIRFADQVRPSHQGHDQDQRATPLRRNTEAHIHFVERQRNPSDGAVLRIPGPRDADAGVDPEMVDESDAVHQTMSRPLSVSNSRRHSEDRENLNVDGHTVDAPRRRNITIEEPTRPNSVHGHIAEDANAAKHTLNALRFRKPRTGEKATRDKSEARTTRSRRGTINSIKSTFTQSGEEAMPYLSWEPTIGRNSAFVDLTESQREELGGIEYRALKSLALILSLYYWGFTIFGIVSLTPWILNSKTYGPIVQQIGQGRVWWAFFTSNSAFNDLGFALTPDSMISFQTAVWPLLLLGFLIIIGNTGFPIMLRFIIWVTSLYVPKNSSIWEELRFLLDHPRRCFTLLFPSKITWYLFWILVILNGLDLIFFIILDLGNSVVTELPGNIRVLDGWFQAVATRTAGFGVVNLAELHPGIQVSYLLMMYISVLPIAISVRRTNVYEERSLGIYTSYNDEHDGDGEPSYVGAHIRRQLSFDLWYIFLGFFIISISEGSRLQSGDSAFSMFSILFEIVSAYGTVGLSLGYTGINASLSAEFGVIAKLVIISMQIRGRHRGLPYELDRAILLPSEHLHEKENTDPVQRARTRSSSTATRVGTSTSGQPTTRTRSKSSQRRQSQNFLSTLLHPGPTIPNSHRNSYKDDQDSDRRNRRDERDDFDERGEQDGQDERGRDSSPMPVDPEARSAEHNPTNGNPPDDRRNFLQEAASHN